MIDLVFPIEEGATSFEERAPIHAIDVVEVKLAGCLPRPWAQMLAATEYQ